MNIVYIVDTLDPNSGVFNVIQTFASNLIEKKEISSIKIFYFFETKRSSKNILESKGIDVFKLNIYSVLFQKNKSSNYIKSVLYNHENIIVHNHVPLFSNLIMPYFRNVTQNCLVHTHSSLLSNSFIKSKRNKALMINSHIYYKEIWGCSSSSIEAWFPKTNLNKKIINNPVDCKLIDKIYLQNDNHSESSDHICIGTVGRMVPEKNHLFLIELLYILNKNQNKKKYSLVIIGDGHLKDEIKNKIDEMKLNKFVIIIEYLEKELLYKTMKNFDVFLLPSKFEGLGITLIEAQMLGIKSIASINVPKESDLGNVTFLPLNHSKWIYEIESMDLNKKNNLNFERAEKFCIENSVNDLLTRYKEVLQ